MDGATAVGIVLVVGSLASSPTLGKGTIDSCVELLAAMESRAELPDFLVVLPEVLEGTLAVADRAIPLKALKDLMKVIAVPWKKLLVNAVAALIQALRA